MEAPISSELNVTRGTICRGDSILPVIPRDVLLNKRKIFHGFFTRFEQILITVSVGSCGHLLQIGEGEEARRRPNVIVWPDLRTNSLDDGGGGVEGRGTGGGRGRGVEGVAVSPLNLPSLCFGRRGQKLFMRMRRSQPPIVCNDLRPRRHCR